MTAPSLPGTLPHSAGINQPTDNPGRIDRRCRHWSRQSPSPTLQKADNLTLIGKAARLFFRKYQPVVGHDFVHSVGTGNKFHFRVRPEILLQFFLQPGGPGPVISPLAIFNGDLHLSSPRFIKIEDIPCAVPWLPASYHIMRLLQIPASRLRSLFFIFILGYRRYNNTI